jgi:hypothetical protein
MSERIRPAQSIALCVWMAATVASALAHDGQPDHPAKHGGVMFASGPFDLEFVLQGKGRYAVYFNTAAGEELPASTASGVTVSIKRSAGPAEAVPLRIDDAGESWLGAGSPSDAPTVSARVSYRFRGKPEEADVPFSTVYRAEFRAAPEAAKAGQPVQLSFTVKDFFGKSVRSLQIVHEKPMHLIVVSRDLAEFWHIHPEPAPGNVYRVAHVFSKGGDYRLYADFTPAGAGNRIEAFDLKVQGPARAAVPVEPTGSTSAAGGVRIALSTDKPLRTGEDIGVSLSLTEVKTGAPIRNLQRYLGAWAHIVVLSQDLQDFIHVHPMEAEASTKSAGPSPETIRTVAGFRRPGVYKMWVQVQREGKVVAIPFVVRVSSGESTISRGPQAPQGAVLVKIGGGGYEPSRIQAKAGRPLKLAFFRTDAQNCGGVVSFPALGIKRDLPPGQTIVIDLVPQKTGSFGFGCGMGMMRGQLVVE